MFSTLKRLTLATAALAFAAQAAATELTLDVYNPGEAAIFPVSSVLVRRRERRDPGRRAVR